MKIGIIGVGVVGQALAKWLQSNTSHEVAKWDPSKGMKDDLRKSDAIFICIPVHPAPEGQDQFQLENCVNMAKGFSEKVFIRSTVLPGTNDRFGTISCPEFLTARIADAEMERLPVLVGDVDPVFISEVFPTKSITIVRNSEAELAKFAHNCFGAMKVTYFNLIYKMCQDLDLYYENVKDGFLLSGFINEPHTMVPGPDGKLGYSGSCFPENMEAFESFLDRTMKYGWNGGGNADMFQAEDPVSWIKTCISLNYDFKKGTEANT